MTRKKNQKLIEAALEQMIEVEDRWPNRDNTASHLSNISMINHHENCDEWKAEED